MTSGLLQSEPEDGGTLPHEQRRDSDQAPTHLCLNSVTHRCLYEHSETGHITATIMFLSLLSGLLMFSVGLEQKKVEDNHYFRE